MAVLEIRKEGYKNFHHYYNNLVFSASDLRISFKNDNVKITRQNGAFVFLQEGFLVTDISIFDDTATGTEETFNDIVLFEQRLIDLGYPAFYEDGQIIPIGLNDLIDTSLNSIQNGQALVYNDVSGKWENEDVTPPDLSNYALKLISDLPFTGVFDVSEERTVRYNDLNSGNLGVLSLSNDKKVGAICTVRLRGTVDFIILNSWNLKGDAISTSTTEYNRLIIIYFAENDIRAVNTVVSITEQFDPETINAEYFRHLFNNDNVTTLEVNGLDEIQTSTDIFTNGDFNLSKTSKPPFLVQDADGYSAKFDYSIGGGQSMKVDLVNPINPIFRSSFSGYLKLRMIDGVPAIEASYFLNLLNGTSSRFWLDVRSSGVVTLAYTSNSVSRFAQTTSSVFVNGINSEYSILAFTLNSAGSMKIYKDAVELPLNGSLNGDLTGVNMSLFNNGTSDLFLGNYDNVNDRGVSMYLKDFAIQKGVYSQGDLNNLQNV